jgi:hypothetical protein
VSKIMMRFFLVLTLLAGLSGAGCGDLSEEDLIFKFGVPQKRQLELQPAGEVSTAETSSSSTSQALGGPAECTTSDCCPKGDLRCQTRVTSRGVNAMTFGLLDLIDRISNLPPTTRKTGVRIWGPYFDIFTNTTARFEISRDAGGKSFSFCVHRVHGRIVRSEAKDITCDTDVDADTGLTKVLFGDFTPGDIQGEAARSGSGSLTLRTDRLPEFKLPAHDISIDFDNTIDNGAGRTIALNVNGAIAPDGSVLTNPLVGDFARNGDGSGSLHFQVIGDVAPDIAGLETATIDALWHADQGGRAVATIETSEATPRKFIEDQCWDRHIGTVFTEAHLTGPNGGTSHEQTGDEAQCLFQCSDMANVFDDGANAVSDCNEAGQP